MTAVALEAPRQARAVDRERLAALGFSFPALLILTGVFALPLALLLGVSVIGPDGLTLAHYRRLFGTAYYLGVIWNSLRLALLTTLIALAIGFPAAFALARARGAVRSLLLAALFLPLAALTPQFRYPRRTGRFRRRRSQARPTHAPSSRRSTSHEACGSFPRPPWRDRSRP